MIFPICKFVSRNEFLISTPSYLGVFIKTSAISERPPIDWGPNVLQIVYSYPYVLCMKIHSISIISLIDQKIKDEFLLEDAVHLDDFDGRIVVASVNSIHLIHRITWEEQIESLLMNEKSREAVDMFQNLYESGMMPQKDFGRLQTIRINAVLIELKRRRFKIAMEFLLECHCFIKEILGLYPNLLKIFQISSKSDSQKINDLIEKMSNELKSTEIIAFLLDYLNSYLRKDHNESADERCFIEISRLILWLEEKNSHMDEIKRFFANPFRNRFDDVVEKYLDQHNYYYFKCLFLNNRKNYRDSIELLVRLEEKQLSDSDYIGIDEICNTLVASKDLKLIINHIEFVLKRDQIKGANVLIEMTEFKNGFFTLLDPEFIIKLLYNYNETMIIYLEFLVFEEKIPNSSLHTNLAIRYIEKLSKIKAKNRDEKEEHKILEKLRKILYESEYYSSKEILKSLSNNELDYEEAFVHGKIGNHRKSFEIFLFKHDDHEQALRHCLRFDAIANENRDPDAKTNSCVIKDSNDGGRNDSSIFEILLKIYLDLYEKNGSKIIKPMLNYLNHSQCHFDLSKTLNDLPGDWPLSYVENHLFNHFHTLFNDVFQTWFGRILALSILERIKQKNQRLRNHSIKIDQNSLCDACQTRLLDAKFVWLPQTRTILHDFCYDHIIYNKKANHHLLLVENEMAKTILSLILRLLL
ncbi:hypothetical protein SSS_01038 [Sarcoptes scabiei]|nr:hypothetical protein SSS_01038 [Sarcoptes scabiei]